jgi:hypothetical protein
VAAVQRDITDLDAAVADVTAVAGEPAAVSG